MPFKIFGFQIGRELEKKEQQDIAKRESPVSPTVDDGALEIGASGSFGAAAFDLDAVAKNTIELIKTYRKISLYPEPEAAIDDIVNEAVVTTENEQPVSIMLDDVMVDNKPLTSKIKKKIQEEFEYITSLMEFQRCGADIFRKWYVDGRLFYHKVIESGKEKNGIVELRVIDPLNLIKIREFIKEKTQDGSEVVKGTREYYLYNDPYASSHAGPGSMSLGTSIGTSGAGQNNTAIIQKEAIVSATSGVMDDTGKIVLS